MTEGNRLKAFLQQAEEGLWDHALYDPDGAGGNGIFGLLLRAAAVPECHTHQITDLAGSDHGVLCSCGWSWPSNDDRFVKAHLDV